MNRALDLSMRRGALAAAFLAAAAVSLAVPQPHPRIWLDAPTVARLQAAATADTPEWQSLESWCDAHLGDNMAEGYQYLDWYSYTLAYGLAYRITGNPAYGNEGVIYLTAMLRDRHAIGDGLGGANAIQIDSGYVSRSMGTGVAIGRDWLDGAPNLTPALIAECTARMADWMTWIHRPETYGIAEPVVNYFAGHFAMTYTAFIAFEGDPGYQSDWETKSESMWVLARDMMNTQGDGGDWPEGWNYGHRAYRHILGYPWALETGTDRPDNHWDEIDMPNDIVRGQIALLHPSREVMSDDGRWTGDFKGDPRSTTALMMSVLSDTGPAEKGLARWYADSLEWEPGGPDRWEAMLFTDHAIAPIAPTPANMGGLAYRMWGHATARGAGWDDQQATFVDVVAWKNSGAEHNFGELKISSREELLVVDGQEWQLESEFANVPRIAGAHTYAPYQEPWHEAASLELEAQDGVFAYFKLANMHHGYNGVNDDTPSAAYFRRDIVFLPPDHTVVFDNIQASTLANTIAEQWHVMGNPTLAGDTATLSATNAKLFLRTVSPAVALSETNTNATRDGSYRVDAAIATPAISNHIVTVFETAPPAQPAMTPVVQLAPAGFTGLHIQSAADPRVILFATAPNAALASATFNFVPTASTTRVVMIGMAPSANFAVTVTDGAGGSLDVTVAPGSGATSGAQGSLTFFATQPSAAVSDWVVY